MKIPITLKPGGNGTDFKTTFRLQRAAPTVTTRVVDNGLLDVDITVTCSESPAVGVLVTFGDLSATTDGDGIAHFTNAAPGTYAVTVEGTGTPGSAASGGALLRDKLTIRPGTLYGRITDTGEEWLPDIDNSDAGAEVVEDLGATNRTNFIAGVLLHSDQLDKDDYYAKVTFLLDAGADFHDKVWLYFNIDPTFTPSTGMSESLTGTSHFRFCGAQLTPKDSGTPNISTTQIGTASAGQMSEASIGGPTLFEFSPDLATGLHTFTVRGIGTKFEFYVDDVFQFDTDNATVLPHWTTAREIFDTPGVGFGFRQKDTDTIVVTAFEAGAWPLAGIPATGCQPYSGDITVPVP